MQCLRVKKYTTVKNISIKADFYHSHDKQLKIPVVHKRQIEFLGLEAQKKNNDSKKSCEKQQSIRLHVQTIMNFWEVIEDT